MKSLKALFVICVFVAAAVAVVDSAKKSFAMDDVPPVGSINETLNNLKRIADEFATDGAAPTSSVSTLVNDLGGLAWIKLDGSALARPIGAGGTYQVQLGAQGEISFGGENYKFQAAQREMLLSAVLKSAVKQTPKDEAVVAPAPAVKKKTVFVNNTDGLVRVKIGYGSFPVVSGDAMEVTRGDTITISDETHSKSLAVGDQPIGAAQVFNGSTEAAIFGALQNDTEGMVYVNTEGNTLAKPLAAHATRYFAAGANAKVRFMDGTAKTAGVMHYLLVSELNVKSQAIVASAVAVPAAASVPAPASTTTPHRSFAVAKIVNSTGLTVRARQTNQYVANTISDGGVMEFRRGEQIEVASDGLLPTKITLSASEVYLMRDGDAIVAVAKVN